MVSSFSNSTSKAADPLFKCTTFKGHTEHSLNKSGLIVTVSKRGESISVRLILLMQINQLKIGNLDLEPPIAPRGNFLHYHFLKPQGLLSTLSKSATWRMGL